MQGASRTDRGVHAEACIYGKCLQLSMVGAGAGGGVQHPVSPLRQGPSFPPPEQEYQYHTLMTRLCECMAVRVH